MPEWITYRLSDLLLFSPRTYYRMFELYHQQIWPAHLVVVGLALAPIRVFGRHHETGSRVVAGLLSLSWIWVAIAFHLRAYAEINWAARYFAGIFILQGLLLLWLAVTRNQRPRGQSARTSTRVLWSLLFIALVLEAVAGLGGGRTWRQLDFPGLTPDATAIATLLILSSPVSRAPRVLLIIPILWCAIGGATLWALGSPEAWIVLLAGIVGLIATVRIPRAVR